MKRKDLLTLGLLIINYAITCGFDFYVATAIKYDCEVETKLMKNTMDAMIMK